MAVEGVERGVEYAAGRGFGVQRGEELGLVRGGRDVFFGVGLGGELGREVRDFFFGGGEARGEDGGFIGFGLQGSGGFGDGGLCDEEILLEEEVLVVEVGLGLVAVCGRGGARSVG